MPDWTERRLAHESRPARCFSKSFTHTVEVSLSKFGLFSFLWVYSQQHTLYLRKKFCVKQMSANHAEMLQCDCAQQVWGRAQYPIAARVQEGCWQDISAGRCICTRPSSETLSAPTLHYHNALGSVKRPAVIWKGNYLLWNLLQQSKEGGGERVEGEWVPIGRGSW